MIDYIHADLFQKSGVKKQLRIAFSGGTITNRELYSEQFSLTEGISSGNTLAFGNCEASSIKFRIRNSFESLVGKSLWVSMALNGDEANPFTMGTYKGYSDTPTADRKYRDVVAYDAMYDIINADVAEWYNSLLFPMTLREFRQSFAWNFGLDEVEAELINDDLVVERTIIAAEISGKTILTAICQINGCFGHINRNGQLEYVRLKNRGGAEISKYKAPLKYENFIVQPITKVQIRQEEDDLGGSYGDGDNVYIVQDNFLAFGKEETDLVSIAEKLLGEIGGITYRPCSVTTLGNPCIEVGDSITVYSSDMDIVSVVLSRTISGIQALQDTYTSSGEEKRLQQLNSAKDELRKLRAKANILSRTLEEAKSLIYELESELGKNYLTSEEVRSEITQNASQVLSEVSKTYSTKGEVGILVEDLQGQIDGNIQTWTGTEIPTLDNYPAADWIDTETKNQHIGDLYYVESEGDSSGFCYRFQQNNGVYEWVLLKDSEITKAVKDAADAIKAAGEIKADLDANYSTTTQIQSAIDQSAEQVRIGVSETYTTKVESEKVLSDAKDYADKAVDKIEIGSKNLIRNSQTMVFVDYYFEIIGDLTSIVTETGAQLITEDGRILVI